MKHYGEKITSTLRRHTVICSVEDIAAWLAESYIRPGYVLESVIGPSHGDCLDKTDEFQFTWREEVIEQEHKNDGYPR